MRNRNDLRGILSPHLPSSRRIMPHTLMQRKNDGSWGGRREDKNTKDRNKKQLAAASGHVTFWMEPKQYVPEAKDIDLSSVSAEDWLSIY